MQCKIRDGGKIEYSFQTFNSVSKLHSTLSNAFSSVKDVKICAVLEFQKHDGSFEIIALLYAV